MEWASLRRTWGAYLPASTPLVAKLFVWAGLLLLVLAGAFAAHTWWSVRSYVRIDATVTENVPTQDVQGLVVSVTHLRFQMPGGRIVNFVDPIRSDDPSFASGDVVPAIYPRQAPEAARIATIWRLYFVANLLGILGVVFVDLGLILKRILKRAAQQRLSRT
jgi:hypothetical protein